MTLLTDLFSLILSTTAMASALVLLILIAKWLLKDKLKPRWAYLLWMLLMFRLLLPWTPESSFSMFNWIPLDKHEAIMSNNRLVLENNEKTTAFPVEPTSVIETVPQPAPAATRFPLMQIASVIWLAGTVLMLGFMVSANVRFASKLKNEPHMQDPRIFYIFENAKREMSIRRKIALLQTNRVASPTLLGMFQPKLLIPESAILTLSSAEFRFVFLHELSHVKRSDIAINWIMSVLLSLHWFNPLLWYTYRMMREDQEIACDASALGRIKPEESKDYALTIIKLLEVFSSPVYVTGAAKISGNQKELKRRILMITSFTKNSYKWSLLGLAVILMISGCALTSARTSTPNTEAVALTPKQEVEKITRAEYERMAEIIGGVNTGKLPISALKDAEPLLQKNPNYLSDDIAAQYKQYKLSLTK